MIFRSAFGILICAGMLALVLVPAHAAECPPGFMLPSYGGCIPLGSVDCGWYACRPGQTCVSGGKCKGGPKENGVKCGGAGCRGNERCGPRGLCYNPTIAKVCGELLCARSQTCGQGVCINPANVARPSYVPSTNAVRAEHATKCPIWTASPKFSREPIGGKRRPIQAPRSFFTSDCIVTRQNGQTVVYKKGQELTPLMRLKGGWDGPDEAGDDAVTFGGKG